METKKEVQKVARELAKKAQSFGQVCKQLSGIRGKIALTNTKSCTVKEAFALLGIKLAKNKVTPADIAAAWAEPLMEARPMHVGGDETARTFSGWRAPLISKAIPVVALIPVNGEEKGFKLHVLNKDGEYEQLRQKELCRIVKAEDRRKGSTDVVVSAQTILRGLAQSVFVTDTLKDLKASKEAIAKITRAWVNTGTATAPKWAEVVKGDDGKWAFVPTK